VAGFEDGEDGLHRSVRDARVVARLREVCAAAAAVVSTTHPGRDLRSRDVGRVQRGTREIAGDRDSNSGLCHRRPQSRPGVVENADPAASLGFRGYDPNLVETYVSSLRRKPEGPETDGAAAGRAADPHGARHRYRMEAGQCGGS